METQQKRKVSLNEVGYRLADVWDKFESGVMDDKTAMVNVKIATAITNTFRTKAIVNEYNGVKTDINDMFNEKEKRITLRPGISGLIDK